MLQKLPIGFRFSLLHRAFRRKLDEMLGEKELTGVQFGVLAALGRLEEECREEISQRDLEQTARLSHAPDPGRAEVRLDGRPPCPAGSGP